MNLSPFATPFFRATKPHFPDISSRPQGKQLIAETNFLGHQMPSTEELFDQMESDTGDFLDRHAKSTA